MIEVLRRKYQEPPLLGVRLVERLIRRRYHQMPEPLLFPAILRQSIIDRFNPQPDMFEASDDMPVETFLQSDDFVWWCEACYLDVALVRRCVEFDLECFQQWK